MAFFKFRKGGDEPAATAAPAESVEALRRRAKHRLIGTVVLVLAGVIGFPLLVDRQPRPVAVDIPIEIPDRNKAKPLAVAPTVEAPFAAVAPMSVAPKASESVAPSPPASAPVAVPADKTERVAESAAAAVAAASSTGTAKAVEKTADKTTERKPSAEDAARARALLEGREASAPAAAEERIVVQVGAFAEAARAREVRLKLERAGLKTYTHVAETKDGRRIRVRVGPFATRAEAEKAAEKIKQLELPAVLLTL